MLRRGLLALLLVSGAAACAGGAVEIPDAVRGRWTTTEPHYASAYVEVTPLSIAFRDAEGGVSSYEITGYHTEGSLQGEVHVVEYAAADGRSGQFAFFLDGDTLRMKNQSGFDWKREGS